MSAEGKDPRGDSEGFDTDEQFQDHPELAPSENRVSIENVKDLDEEARKRSLAGDPVEDAGDRHHKIELEFTRNNDFAGNEAALSTDADDFSRGSGFIGGKLVGEGQSGEDYSPVADEPHHPAEGFTPSVDQLRNIEAIRREDEESLGDWSAHPRDLESEVSQGRDFPRPGRATGTQAFGRDMGATGLDQEEREEQEAGPGRQPPTAEQKLWASILRRLGGSSPGSEENLQLAAIFSNVQYPADRPTVMQKLAPGAEFRLKEGIEVDLKKAVEQSRMKIFRNLGDLVDSVKDELRRMEKSGLTHLKLA